VENKGILREFWVNLDFYF